MMQAPVGKLGVGICSLALLLCVIGLSIPYWVTEDVKGSDDTATSYHSGLWDYCGTDYNGVYVCSPPEVVYDTPKPRRILNALRAMELLGMFVSIAALVLGGIKEFNIKILMVRDRVLGKCAGVSALIAGGFMLIGVIVFVSEKDTLLPWTDITVKFGPGFALCIAAGVLSIISGFIFMFNKDETYTYDRHD